MGKLNNILIKRGWFSMGWAGRAAERRRKGKTGRYWNSCSILLCFCGKNGKIRKEKWQFYKRNIKCQNSWWRFSPLPLSFSLLLPSSVASSPSKPFPPSPTLLLYFWLTFFQIQKWLLLHSTRKQNLVGNF